MSDSLTGREIAVIGMAGRFPGGRNLAEFWQNLRNGVESVTFFSDDELLASGIEPELLRDPNYVRAGSLLDEVDLFDASFFGYTAREAETLDPQQRIFLEAAWHALENAGCSPHGYEGAIGVYAGAAWNTYLLSNLTTHPELFDRGGGFQVFIASDKDFMPTRVAYKLNLKGPSVIIQTSCSTSLVAVHLACLSLLNYECDIALAGGVTVKVPQKAGYFYQEGGLASPDGHCRAFDARAAGTIFGSGVGVVVLKRFSEALEDRDNIRAVIKASAINNDGSAKVSYTAPSVEGQTQVVAAAHAMAGFPPETIRYIETHGTGTSLGDPVEITALTKVFRNSVQRNGFCAIGSVKSNIGHLDAAAGIAGFIKTVLALDHKELPPSINYTSPNPAIDFPETPFYVNSSLTEWESPDVARRAAVSSFGVGGTNAHVVLEEAPSGEPGGSSRPWQLLLLSARTASALDASTANLLSFLRENKETALPDVGYTLQIGRTVFRHRRLLVCSNPADAIDALGGSENSRVLTSVDTEDPRARPVVFMFPGQGSQYLQMGRELYENEITFRRQFDDCAKLLKTRAGFDLRTMLYSENPTEPNTARIDQTSMAQPALFAFEYSLAQLWIEWGVNPAAMIGHSVGEYVAACLAGVMSVDDALSLVAIRGRLMQEQPAGGMLAVSLAEEEMAILLPQDISIAAVNEPSSSVVSGPLDVIAEFEEELAGQGVGFRRLHTSHAFHSRMMEPVLRVFTREVQRVRLQPPRIPFISNLTGDWITAEEATSPNYWARHVRETVRFSRGMKELFNDPDRVFLEVGPGRVLSTLANRHHEGRGRVLVCSVRHPQEEVSDGSLILESLGRLWLAGVKVDWRGFYKHEHRRRVALPVYPFERQRFWIEPAPRSVGREAADSQSVVIKKANKSEWFYLPSWKPSLLSGSGNARKESWLVMLDEFGFAEGLASHLVQQGRGVVTVRRGDGFRRLSDKTYSIRLECSDDYEALLGDLQNNGHLPRAIVHASSLTETPPGSFTVDTFDALQESGFYSLLLLLRALLRYAQEEVDLTVVSNWTLGTMGEDPVLAEKTPMLGVCRVAAQEFTNVTTRFVDLAPPGPNTHFSAAHIWDSLVLEVDSAATDKVIAYRGRHRWVQGFEQVYLQADQGTTPLRERGVYLITGGLSGNGLGFARYLARTVRARLVLVEDHPDGGLPQGPQEDPADRLREIESLTASGAEVFVVTADLTDPTQLQQAWLEGESRFGAIHGVIHALEPVGSMAFRAIWEATREECDWHFRPKVRAVYALDSVLKEKEIDFCVLLSSLATVLGGVGYGPYAAANLFMDSFVIRHNRSNNVPWLSLNWDLWSNEESQDRIAEIRGDLSELAMTAREGEEAFRSVLAARGADQILVSTADLSARLSFMQQRFEGLHARLESKSDPTPGAIHPRPSLPVPFVAPETDWELRIAKVWQQVLGFEQIGVQDNFFELGGDSLIAIQVAARLKQELSIDFPVAKLYQGVTVRSLAQLLSENDGEASMRRTAQSTERMEATDRRKKYIERRRARASPVD